MANSIITEQYIEDELLKIETEYGYTRDVISLIYKIIEKLEKELNYIYRDDSNGNKLYIGDKVNCLGGAFYNGHWEYNEIFTICREKEDIFLKNEDYITYFFCFDKMYKL